MSETRFLKLEFIFPNPYQARLVEDPAAIAELAASIERDGLMQIPVGREWEIASGARRIQLAFGHSRLAAYRLLESQGKLDFDQMPVSIRELTDVQMFELAIGENIKRRNLNVIELATAMQRYMDEFGKTSEQTGEIFGVSAETVRGNVRLLNLPADVQVKVGDGTLTIGAARALLSVQKIAPAAVPEAVELVQEWAADDAKFRIYDTVDEAIAGALGEQKTVKQMHEHDTPFLETEPKKFPHKHLHHVTPQQAQKLLGLTSQQAPTADLAQFIQQLELGTPADQVASRPVGLEEAERLQVLVAPPKCTQCPLHTQIDGTHFCGMVMCYERKTRAWKAGQLDDVSKKTKIPLYDASKDGDVKVLLRHYEPAEVKLFDAKGEDLRLVPQGNAYSGFDGLGRVAAAVVVGKSAEKLIKSAEKKGETANTGTATSTLEREAIRQEQEQRHQNETRMARFAWEVAVPAFLSVLDGIKSFQVLRALIESLELYNEWAEEVEDYPRYFSDDVWKDLAKKKPAVQLQTVRSWLVFDMLNRMAEEPDLHNKKVAKKYVETFAIGLQELAKAWGVKLPKDWLETAKSWDSKELEPESA